MTLNDRTRNLLRSGLTSSSHPGGEEVDSEGTWALSYGDMVTLLLCFFLLFFSVDSRKTDNAKNLQQSLVAALSAKPVSTDDKKSGISIGHEKQDNALDETVLTQFGGKVQRVGSRIMVSFPEISFFKFSETDVTPDGAEALKKFARLYLPFAGTHTLAIKAYTDDKKVMLNKKARYRDNLELSALRGVAGIRTLQMAGLPLNRMRLGGQGVMRLDQKETEMLLKAQTSRERGLALARKIILSIEPDPKEAEYAK